MECERSGNEMLVQLVDLHKGLQLHSAVINVPHHEKTCLRVSD